MTRRKRPLYQLRAAEAGLLFFLCAIGAIFVLKIFLPPVRRSIVDPRYEFSLVDVWGRRLSPMAGPLKYMLSPETFARPAPNLRLPWLNTDEFGNRLTTGDAPGRPKAVLLGGSTAFGYGANSDDETISSQLQRLAPRWRWVNMAASGFASGEELGQMIFNGDSLEPTLYVSISGLNDYANSVWVRDGLPFGRNHNFLLQTSDQLASLMREPPAGGRAYLPPSEPPDVLAERLATYKRNVLRMQAFSRARGARFVLAIQPWALHYRDPSQKDPLTCAFPYLKEFVPGLLEFCRTSGLTCVNLTDPGLGLPESEFLDCAHLTAQGNERIARAIASVL